MNLPIARPPLTPLGLPSTDEGHISGICTPFSAGEVHQHLGDAAGEQDSKATYPLNTQYSTASPGSSYPIKYVLYPGSQVPVTRELEFRPTGSVSSRPHVARDNPLLICMCHLVLECLFVLRYHSGKLYHCNLWSFTCSKGVH